MIIVFGDALARARMVASSVFGYVYVRRIPDDSNASANYLTDLETTQPEPSSTASEGHHLPLDHNFFQDNQSDLDFESSDNGATPVPLSVFLPLGVMLLFAALILLIVMFRRHPAAVMTIAAAALLAAGAYNLLILFQSSGDANGYHSVFSLQTPPKYE